MKKLISLSMMVLFLTVSAGVFAADEQAQPAAGQDQTQAATPTGKVATKKKAKKAKKAKAEEKKTEEQAPATTEQPTK